MLYNAYSQKLSGQQTSRSRKEPVSYLNVMVVGQAGTGKTMFVRTLCERLKSNIIQGTLKESRSMALKEPLCPTEDYYSISMHVEENGERVSFTLIDTPGFDDGLVIDDQLDYVAKYIDHQFERTLVEESKVKRDTKALDTHIHACLYFLDTVSDSLSDIDRYAIRALSSRVNVIPVIGKADTLTILKQEALKKGLRKDIFDNLQIPIYGFIELEDDDDDDDDEEKEKEKEHRVKQQQDGNRGEQYSDNKDKNEQPQQDEQYRVEAQERGSLNMTRILQRLREYADEDDDDARAMVEYLEHMPYTLIAYEGDPDTGRPLTIRRDQDAYQQQKQQQQQQQQQEQQQQENENGITEPETIESTSDVPNKVVGNNNNQQQKINVVARSRSNGSNKTVLGRQYPWAVVECCNPDHCDLEKLRSMIVSGHRDMLRIDTFERFYETYRTEKLLRRRVDKLTATETKDGKILA